MKTPSGHRKLRFVLGLVGALFCNGLKAAGAFPIATNPGTEQTFSFAFDGTNYLVGIQGDEIAHFNVTAQLLGPTGALIGARIKVGRTGGVPHVAFDGTNYLLVWEDDANSPNDDIYGQLVSRSGTLVGTPFAISTAPNYQHLDAMRPLAFGGGKYLVVYRDDRTGTKSVYGRLVSPSGALFGAEITIDADTSSAQEASVAFDGTNFLVVWQKRTGAPQEQHDTRGVFVSPSGTIGTPIIISQTTSARHNPLNLVFNGTNYLVTWNRDVGPGSPSPTQWDIYGRFVSPAGTFPGNEIALVAGTNDEVFPGISFDGANYLVSWTERVSGTTNYGVNLQFFNSAGQAVGPIFSPFGAQGADRPFAAVTLFDGNRLAVMAMLANVQTNFSFSSGDVYGMFIPKSFAAPQLQALSFRNGEFSLVLTGTPGINYAIQGIGNLSLTNWRSLVTNSSSNGTFGFTDIDAANATRFYRGLKQ